MELNLEGSGNAVPDRPGQSQQVCGAAVAIDQGQGVLGGEPDPSARSGISLAEAGPLDEPGGGQFRATYAGRVARVGRLGAEPVADGGVSARGLALVQDGIGEEG